MSVMPAELVAECLAGGVRRLIGGVHSLTSSRAVVVCVDDQWVRVRFSAAPGVLSAPWEDDGDGWVRAARGSEPGLRDASADPVLVVVGVAETHLVAINALAVDEIAVTCAGREALIANWVLQAQVQGADGDEVSVAGAVLSVNPDATVVVADPITAAGGWVDVLAVGTAWPVRPLRTAEGRDDGTLAGEPGAEGGAGALGVGAATPFGPTGTEPADPVVEAAVVGGDAGADDGAVQPVCGAASMRVFGGFEVLDAAGLALQPMQQDLVGGIAFHAPVRTQQLCQLVFGQPEKPPSFHVALSKMRRRGINPVLIDGGYRLEIDSDWTRFMALVGADPAAADTDALVEAAALIGGPLFGGVAPRWARDLVGPMRARTGAVCRELAARHSDRPAQALRYAQLGLSVDPASAELSEIIDTIGGQLSAAGSPR